MDRDGVTQMFMEITGVSPEQAGTFLQVTNWQLDGAVELYFAQAQPTQAEPPVAGSSGREEAVVEDQEEMTSEVRPPIPVKREALYDDGYIMHRTATDRVTPFRNFAEERTETRNNGPSTLAEMYRPPLELICPGNFEQVKTIAAKQGRWLIVNLQSEINFSSHQLNSDTWSHETVKEMIGQTFVFWQVSDDVEEGKKVCTYYRIGNLPAILVLDPITGQKMKVWHGYVSPQQLLEDLVEFMDRGPLDSFAPKKPPAPDKRSPDVKELDEDEELQRALAASMETGPEPIKEVLVPETKYPELPAEPADGPDCCRVGVRFPNGTRRTRRYLKTDPLAYLWSFCCLHETEAASGRKFRLTIPGMNGGALEYDSITTMGEAGVANSLLQLTWV